MFKDSGCYKFDVYNKIQGALLETDCQLLVDQIGTQCSLQSKRQQIDFLLPPFDKEYICSATGISTCQPYFYDKDRQLALESGKNYDVKNKLEHVVKSQAEKCVNDSMALILTDIPCSEYSNFPDLQMFDDKNVNQTAQWLKDLRLRTYVFYFNNGNSCTKFASYGQQTTTNYLTVKTMSYNQSLLNFGDICSWTFSEPENHHSSASSNTGHTVIIVVCSLVAVLIVVCIVIVGFCLCKRRRRHHESRHHAHSHY
ncbi:hypothetical protein M3Y94_00055500 [Aphelenchoides besseyi]|nr:hypothetical protein M3Y94_00055500 [Aphelenchoides besseyi]